MIGGPAVVLLWHLQGILGCSSAVERPAVNRYVVGSNPASPAKTYRPLRGASLWPVLLGWRYPLRCTTLVLRTFSALSFSEYSLVR